MRKMTVPSVILLLACWWSGATLEAHPKMAEGFRDVRLGTERSAMPGLVAAGEIRVPVDIETEGVCKLYVRENEALSHLGITLEKIEYGFVEDRLDRIRVHAKGMDAFRALSADAIERYGTKKDPVETFEYKWEMDGESHTETIGIYHEAIRHEESKELEHVWTWGVPETDWIFSQLSIRYNEDTGAVLLTVFVPVTP